MTTADSAPAHRTARIDGIDIHYARLAGGDRPLILLHGWPEF
jgi:pimeloyl-ACP methyl ester carboxylesterase